MKMPGDNLKCSFYEILNFILVPMAIFHSCKFTSMEFVWGKKINFVVIFVFLPFTD